MPPQAVANGKPVAPGSQAGEPHGKAPDHAPAPKPAAELPAWGHSALPTLLGVPAVLAFGCYASFAAGSRRPVAVAGAFVVFVCWSLRQAAVQEFYV